MGNLNCTEDANLKLGQGEGETHISVQLKIYPGGGDLEFRSRETRGGGAQVKIVKMRAVKSRKNLSKSVWGEEKSRVDL